MADGLWRWTASHPEWKPGGGWDRDVGCVYWEGDDAVVLVDPLIPVERGERDRFLEALDRDVARVARPVCILLTCEWHERSSPELVQRYDGRLVKPGDESLPAGVTAVKAAEEIVLWLGPVRTVVPGDVILGADKGLELCPDAWLGPGGRRALARELRPLLDLSVERVLTSHGPPVLADGRTALARAVELYDTAA